MSESDTSQSEFLRCFTCGKTYLDTSKKCPSCGTPSKGAARVRKEVPAPPLAQSVAKGTALPFEQHLLAEMKKQTKSIRAILWAVFVVIGIALTSPLLASWSLPSKSSEIDEFLILICEQNQGIWMSNEGGTPYCEGLNGIEGAKPRAELKLLVWNDNFAGTECPDGSTGELSGGGLPSQTPSDECFLDALNTLNKK